MNSKAEFFRLAGSTVVIEYKDKSIITSIVQRNQRQIVI